MPLDAELKAAIEGLTAEHKSAVTGLMAKYDALQTKTAQMQTQLDAVDGLVQGDWRHISDGGKPDGIKAIADALVEHKDAFDRHGRVRFEVPTLLPEGKSTILSTDLTSTEPSRGVQGAGRFPYRLRRLFRSVPTGQPTVGVLRSVTETILASPQTEGSTKSESTMTFTLAQIPIQTVAHFVNFSKQAMDDLDGFQEFIRSTLVWGLERTAEVEIISGDGTGTHLTGLVPGATAFDTTILSASAGWGAIDILGAAAVQLREAGWDADFAVISPREWFKMVSLKDDNGQYVLASPRTTMGERAYGLTIVPSDQMTGTSFLVGDSSKAVIRQRQRTTVELSREHGTNYTANLVTALAEERFGLQVLRPDAFVQGSLTSSPA